MKKQIIFTLIICAIAGFSCKKGESMSEKRAKERAAIAKYIADNDLQITEADNIPDDAVSGENEYYRLPSGLYIQILEKGTGEKPKTGDVVTFRYYTFNLSNDTLVKAMSSDETMNVINSSYAVEYKYGNGSISNCTESEYYYHSYIRNDAYIIKGIQEAIGHLKYGGAAYLIVPSSIGCTEAQSDIQALRYEIRHIKIW